MDFPTAAFSPCPCLRPHTRRDPLAALPRWFRARPSPTRPGLESWWWGAFFLPFLPSFFPSTSALTCTCSCTHIYASASAPRGFEPLRAEPCGLLAHLSSATQTRCFLMHLCNFFFAPKKLPPIGSMSLCNRHRRDSNPCGQSPMDFESISLAARTQCLLPAGDQVCRHRPVTYQPVLFSAFLRSDTRAPVPAIHRPPCLSLTAFEPCWKVCMRLQLKGLWRNGGASDSRSGGWEFESLWPHILLVSSSCSSCSFLCLSNCACQWSPTT